MPDHLHFFVAIDDQRINLSEWMKSLKGVLSANLREAKKQPPYWQKGFFDHALRSSDSYAEKWNYVRENPVRAGLVSRWEEWPYLGEVNFLEYHRDRD
jgi:putative transposase